MLPPKQSAPNGHAKQKLATVSLVELDDPKLYVPLGQGVQEARNPETATNFSYSGTAKHAGKQFDANSDSIDGGL